MKMREKKKKIKKAKKCVVKHPLVRKIA